MMIILKMRMMISSKMGMRMLIIGTSRKSEEEEEEEDDHLDREEE